MFYKKEIIILLSLIVHATYSQKKERKSIIAARIEIPPKIDGLLNDQAWKNIEVAKDFVVFRPNNGKPAPKEYATEVKIVYDDNAIYISAKMLDPEPDKIPREFAVRDNRG